MFLACSRTMVEATPISADTLSSANGETSFSLPSLFFKNSAGARSSAPKARLALCCLVLAVVTKRDSLSPLVQARNEARAAENSLSVPEERASLIVLSDRDVAPWIGNTVETGLPMSAVSEGLNPSLLKKSDRPTGLS